MNWRKPLIYLLLYASGSKIPKYLKDIRRVSKLSTNDIKKYQEEKLSQLLLHAYSHVPYYREVLPKAGVIVGGKVVLKNFSKIPILTKEIIRKEGERLLSDDAASRKAFLNRTGGSTGQPLEFYQDKAYEEQNYANKMWYASIHGKQIGECEMKVWGSERDLLEGTIGFQNKVKFWVWNRVFENSFDMSEKQMEKIVSDMNSHKPVLLWGYVNSLQLLSEFIISRKVSVHKPHVVFSAAGTLSEDVRKVIKQAFGARVMNVYGSREMGDFAIEVHEDEKMRVFSHSHHVEFLGSSEFKDIIVTSLNNYSYPMIRYMIGDVSKGVSSDGFMHKVLGRQTEVVRRVDGTGVPPEYFIHMVGVVYNTGFIDRFQVVQEAVDKLVVKIVLKGKKDEGQLAKISVALRKVMGKDCVVEYQFVKRIATTKSGKYAYVVVK